MRTLGCLIITFAATFISSFLYADDVYPTINAIAVIENGTSEESVITYSGSAPLKVLFLSNVENAEGWSSYYEWRFTHEDDNTPYLIRYEPDTEYTFTRAGLHSIELYATFQKGSETIEFKEEYWSNVGPITITISESKLEMPNAFSPNGDGINDKFKAKEGYQSLTEFHAYIFNRWGQKLFEWTDPADGWDGTYNGKPVKQGVYFVLVEAKGADGREYKIRRDVNLLRSHEEGGTISNP